MICGIDEAGRGPLAGPVTAAAVILGSNFPIDILNDSKKLSEAKREKIAIVIKKEAICYATGWAWQNEIDRWNIHRATLLAMYRAIKSLSLIPDKILVDGCFTPLSGIESEAIIKGDTKIPEIMAASIIAKTSRDRWMSIYSVIEPDYLFEKHKGYPTKAHRDLVKKLGMCAIHRRSFTVS